MKIVDASSGALLGSYAFPSQRLFGVFWAPDGDYFAIATLTPDDDYEYEVGSNIDVIRSRDGVRTMTFSGELIPHGGRELNLDSASWSPDQRQLAIGWGYSESGDVVIGDVVTGQVETLPPLEGTGHFVGPWGGIRTYPVWSPDGEILYTYVDLYWALGQEEGVYSGPRIAAIETDGSNDRVLFDEDWSGPMSWSPDGSCIAVTAPSHPEDATSIMLVDINMREATRLLTYNDARISALDWQPSPDSACAR